MTRVSVDGCMAVTQYSVRNITQIHQLLTKIAIQTYLTKNLPLSLLPWPSVRISCGSSSDLEEKDIT